MYQRADGAGGQIATPESKSPAKRASREDTRGYKLIAVDNATARYARYFATAGYRDRFAAPR